MGKALLYDEIYLFIAGERRSLQTSFRFKHDILI